MKLRIEWMARKILYLPRLWDNSVERVLHILLIYSMVNRLIK